MILWYPKAVKNVYPIVAGRVYVASAKPKGLLHTTEGRSLPRYNNSAPHFTHDPKTGKTWQHYPINYPAMSLAQKGIVVQTNKAKVIQIEIIGTCDPKHKNDPDWFFVPNKTAAQLKGLPELMRWIEQQWGVKPVSTVVFRPYPESYGAKTGRLSNSQWINYNGWCGHQHCPGNNHGDPGNINIKALLPRVITGVGKKGTSAPVPIKKAPAPKPPAKPVMSVWPGTSYVSLGKKNAYVKQMQLKLRSLGFAKYNPSGATGLYGSETRRMVQEFQRPRKALWDAADKGPDGLVGPKTWAAIRAA